MIEILFESLWTLIGHPHDKVVVVALNFFQIQFESSSSFWMPHRYAHRKQSVL